MRQRLRELYDGDGPRAQRFRYWLLAFDLATIVYVIATSFTDHGPVVGIIDLILGLILLADFLVRVWIAARPLRSLMHWTTLADAAAIASFLTSLAGGQFGFLRVLRTLRLLHTYQTLRRLRRDWPWFERREEVATAAINLVVFLFVMTGLVYATQWRSNDQIDNYGDALYFTVTALTTTGFGDITLEGTLGRTIAVVVMIFGVTLFLRLAQVLFRPAKVREPCSHCGLQLHEPDAVHCKHCGEVIRIETEGET